MRILELLFFSSLFVICAGCTSTHENCAVFSQFAYEENFGREESVPDTIVFSSLTLGPEWIFPNGPVQGMKYVDERPKTIVHGISLPCAQVSSNRGSETPNCVAHLIQSKQFAVMVEMFFESKDGDAAGLLVSMDKSSDPVVSKSASSDSPVLESRNAHYFFCRIPTGLALRRMNDKGSDILAETELPDFVTRVYLRMERNGPLFSFYYRYEGSGPDDWTPVAEGIDACPASSENSDLTSIIIGLFAEHTSKGTAFLRNDHSFSMKKRDS